MWIGLALALAAIFALALFASAQRDAERKRVWGAFARERGLSLVTNEGLLGTQCVIEGSLEGVELKVDTFTKSSGSGDSRRSQTYTRVIASGPEPLMLGAKIYAEHAFSGLGKMLGFQDVEVGDSTFDETFVVKADDPAAVLVLLSSDVRKALLEAGNAIRFEYERGVVLARRGAASFRARNDGRPRGDGGERER